MWCSPTGLAPARVLVAEVLGLQSTLHVFLQNTNERAPHISGRREGVPEVLPVHTNRPGLCAVSTPVNVLFFGRTVPQEHQRKRKATTFVSLPFE